MGEDGARCRVSVARLDESGLGELRQVEIDVDLTVEQVLSRLTGVAGGTVGTRIRSLRQGRGWTGTELAQRSGVQRTLLSTIENGASRPRADTLKKLADALGVSVPDLDPGTTNNNNSEKAEQ